MRAIKIDATNKTVSVVELPDNSASKEWRTKMCELLATDILEPVGLGGPVTLWVDEEGLLKLTPGPFFCIGKNGVNGPVISKYGVLLENDPDDGEPTDFTHSVDLVWSIVTFLPEGWKFKRINTVESTVDHPILGRVSSIVQKSVFEDEDGNEHTQ